MNFFLRLCLGIFAAGAVLAGIAYVFAPRVPGSPPAGHSESPVGQNSVDRDSTKPAAVAPPAPGSSNENSGGGTAASAPAH